jgi:opacity protein-like surface antigen
MGSLKTLAMAGVVLAGATTVAAAADLRGPVGLPPAPVALPIAESSGWYLRGDVGFGAIDGSPTITAPPGFPATPATVKGHNPSFGNYGVIGVGAGYQWNSWFRTDVTVDYRTKADMKFGDKYCVDAAGNGLGGVTCTPAQLGATGQNGFNTYNGRVSAMTFLLNGYLDLGNWNGLTPFVGAGVGFANLKVSGLTDQGVNQFAAFGGALGPVPTSYYGDKSKTNFAWALMAGVGYDVNERLKLELGYRYVNMGSIKDMSGCSNPSCGIIGVKDIDAHEFRLGMRWMLGGPAVAAAPMGYPAHVTKKF